MSELILNCSAIESVSGLPCKEPGKPSESLCDHNRSEAWAGPPWEHQQLSGWQQCKHSPAAAPLQSPKNTHGKVHGTDRAAWCHSKTGFRVQGPLWNPVTAGHLFYWNNGPSVTSNCWIQMETSRICVPHCREAFGAVEALQGIIWGHFWLFQHHPGSWPPASSKALYHTKSTTFAG